MLDGDLRDAIVPLRGQLTRQDCFSPMDPRSQGHWTLDKGFMSHDTRDYRLVLFVPADQSDVWGFFLSEALTF